MKVDLSEHGATIDAEDLGPLLGIAPKDVPAKMRNGEITSLSETGTDSDQGHIRLTFWYAQRRVRITCDMTGQVLKTSRTTMPRQ